VRLLAEETPASFITFDLLAVGNESLVERPFAERRARLEEAVSSRHGPVYVTPLTNSYRVAERWFRTFEGAGLDGVVAKPPDLPYIEDQRVMFKVKHARTADCVVAGFRWYKDTRDAVGSLLLGLYDERGVLHHVGVTSAFTMAMRRSLLDILEPLRSDALVAHPWRDWANEQAHATTRMPGGQSRWSAGKDLSWEPVRIERVCEVKYDHLQGDRFRHATHFVRWRPDKPPQACRYDQLETTTPYELRKVFGAAAS
jgi:ATP-dependent DNA ligase